MGWLGPRLKQASRRGLGAAVSSNNSVNVTDGLLNEETVQEM